MAPVNAQALSLEALDDIRAAQDVLDKHAARLAAIGDPVAATVAACAAVVKVSNQLLAGTAEQIAGLHGDAKKQAAREATPIVVEEVARSVDRLVMQRNRHFVMAATITILLTVVVGIAIDRWLLPGTTPVALVCEPHKPGQTFNCMIRMQDG
jgi:hypothetical protein